MDPSHINTVITILGDKKMRKTKMLIVAATTMSSQERFSKGTVATDFLEPHVHFSTSLE